MKNLVAMFSVLFAATICFALPAAASADERGDSIAKKHFAVKKADDTKADATMTLVAKSGSQKVRKLQINYKETVKGKNAFLVFSSPADIAGTKFLTLANKGSDSDQRLYLPGLKNTRKISSSGKDGEFVNSDFYFYDMEDRYYEDYNYTFMSENEALPDAAFAGMKFFKVSMTPKATNSPYVKTVAWVNMSNYLIYQMQCFDKKDGALLKTIKFVKIPTIKGVYVPTDVVVVNHKKGTKTMLSMSNVQVNIGLKDDVFSVQNLEQ